MAHRSHGPEGASEWVGAPTHLAYSLPKLRYLPAKAHQCRQASGKPTRQYSHGSNAVDRVQLSHGIGEWDSHLGFSSQLSSVEGLLDPSASREWNEWAFRVCAHTCALIVCLCGTVHR